MTTKLHGVGTEFHKAIMNSQCAMLNSQRSILLLKQTKLRAQARTKVIIENSDRGLIIVENQQNNMMKP